MAEITAAKVKELRERTGSGMMDCKKALAETNGDMEKAIDYLREKGLAKAAKKAAKEAEKEAKRKAKEAEKAAKKAEKEARKAAREAEKEAKRRAKELEE